MQYPGEMEKKNKETAYILWACGIFLVNGLHRFYLGKIGTGLLWFFTFGLFGIGWLIDGITLGNQVDLVNYRNQSLLEKDTSRPVNHVYHVQTGTEDGSYPRSSARPVDADEVRRSPEQELKHLTQRLRKLDKLFMNEFLSDEEYGKQKDSILKDMTSVVNDDHPEEAIMLFAQLREEGVIDERDFTRVKGVLLS